MRKYKTADIVIIVPQREELLGVLSAFEVNPKMAFRLDWHNGHECPVSFHNTTLKQNDGSKRLSVKICLMDKTGNHWACRCVAKVMYLFNPALIFLVGSAAGHRTKTKIGEVVTSLLVLDFQRKHVFDREIISSPLSIQPHHMLENSMADFLSRFRKSEWRNELKEIVRRISEEQENSDDYLQYFNEINKLNPHRKHILSDNSVLASPEYVKRLFNQSSDARAYDMESAGFGGFCNDWRIPWLTIRGISDNGDEPSSAIKSLLQTTASASAAILLKIFLSELKFNGHYKR